MPQALTYPGIYVEEVPSPVRTIVPLPTAVAAFVGRARRGPVQKPIRIHSFADFERIFGGLWNQSELGYSVSQYFLNGGSDAFVVRLMTPTVPSFATAPPTIGLATPAGPLEIAPENPGSWFSGVKLTVDHDTRKIAIPPAAPAPLADEYNLTVTLEETDPVTHAVETIATERFRNLSSDPAKPNFITTVLARDSALVRTFAVPNAPPGNVVNAGYTGPALGDGLPLTAADLTPASGPAGKEGIFALEDADIFTLLVIPPYSPNEPGVNIDLPAAVWGPALAYCEDRRAMLLIDSPHTWQDSEDARTGLTAFDNLRHKNSVMYFPHILFPDPLLESRGRRFAPSGAIAGVIARIDASRGVWKAPAGEEAKIIGTESLAYTLTDPQNGDLNPLGLNCFRTFPILGTVAWGARTLVGADAQASEWKYLPVRRVALFIEETLYRNTKWILFEGNDEPLWAQIRLNIGAFMNSLFRQGAFQGLTPREAYFVKCDRDTTTQDDINRGVVNILVGFAPLKPVEFVVLKISQITGQLPV